MTKLSSPPEPEDETEEILVLSDGAPVQTREADGEAKKSPARGGDESAVQDGREDDVVEIVVHDGDETVQPPEPEDETEEILVLSDGAPVQTREADGEAKKSPARGGDESAVQDGREDDVVEIVVYDGDETVQPPEPEDGTEEILVMSDDEPVRTREEGFQEDALDATEEAESQSPAAAPESVDPARTQASPPPLPKKGYYYKLLAIQGRQAGNSYLGFKHTMVIGTPQEGSGVKSHFSLEEQLPEGESAPACMLRADNEGVMAEALDSGEGCELGNAPLEAGSPRRWEDGMVLKLGGRGFNPGSGIKKPGNMKRCTATTTGT